MLGVTAGYCDVVKHNFLLFWQDQLPGSGNFGLSAPKRERKQLSPNSDVSKYGTVKKSFNRCANKSQTSGQFENRRNSWWKIRNMTIYFFIMLKFITCTDHM